MGDAVRADMNNESESEDGSRWPFAVELMVNGDDEVIVYSDDIDGPLAGAVITVITGTAAEELTAGLKELTKRRRALLHERDAVSPVAWLQPLGNT